jgi:hypothetical protein
MAHLFRLISVVLAMLAVAASAAVPQSTTYGYDHPGYGASGRLQGSGFSTAVLACQDFIARSNPYRSSPVFFREVLGLVCRYDRPAGTFFESQQLTSGLSCPANSTVSGSTCGCNAGYVENSAGTACELPPDPCKALRGQSAGTWWKDQGDDNGKPMKVGFSVCDRYNNTGGGLCVVTVGTGPDTLCVQAPGGWWQCSGPGYYTGSKAADSNKCSVGPAAGSGASPEDPSPASPPISENPPKPPSTPAPGALPSRSSTWGLQRDKDLCAGGR